LPQASSERLAGFPLRELANEEEVLHPDHVVMPRHREQLFDALRGLQPGVTEIVLHPAVDSPELRAYTSDWTSQVEDHQLLVDDAQIGALLKDVPRISYRQLRLIQQGKDPD
jgi:hypothetical protein